MTNHIPTKWLYENADRINNIRFRLAPVFGYRNGLVVDKKNSKTLTFENVADAMWHHVNKIVAKNPTMPFLENTHPRTVRAQDYIDEKQKKAEIKKAEKTVLRIVCFVCMYILYVSWSL